MYEPSSDMMAETIVALIEAAFRGVRREDGITLHEARIIDRCVGERRRAKARRLDAERRWQDVPGEDIAEHNEALSFMDAKGFRYYLPAYMTWTLRNYRSSDAMTIDWTIYTLASVHGSVEADSRYSLLTPQQRHAICRFLRYFAASSEGFVDEIAAEAALSMGWASYCEATEDVTEPQSPQTIKESSHDS